MNTFCTDRQEAERIIQQEHSNKKEDKGGTALTSGLPLNIMGEGTLKGRMGTD